MTKVTLIGDSIRGIGYGSRVPELLGEDFTVWQPKENARFARYTLRGMWDWAAPMAGSDVVHWNNGLWDTTQMFGDGSFTPLEDYVATMARIGRILKSRHPHVIFATTTPVLPEHKNNNTEVIRRYNAAVVPVLEKLGIVINDLHTAVSADMPRYIREDWIHLSPEGIELCAGLVADSIRSVLK